MLAVQIPCVARKVWLVYISISTKNYLLLKKLHIIYKVGLLKKSIKIISRQTLEMLLGLCNFPKATRNRLIFTKTQVLNN